MKRLNILCMGVFIMMVFLVYADGNYDSPLTLEEFSLLNDSELIDWNDTIDSIINQGDDIVYYFSMNAFYRWEDDDFNVWLYPYRANLYLQCYEELNCSEFYENSLVDVKSNEYNYYKEIQSEYEE